MAESSPTFDGHPGPEYERRQPDGSVPGWAETLRLDALCTDADGIEVGLTTQISRLPARGRMEFVASLLSDGALPVVLVEDDIAVPERRWEIRASGLWADHVCERPLEHWSYGLEAFALALEDPDELLRDGVGHRVPLGWELEFEAGAPAAWLPGNEDFRGYTQLGRVHGVLLDGSGETAVAGSGVRAHWWGVGHPSAAGVARPAGPSSRLEMEPAVALRYRHQPGVAAVTLDGRGLATTWSGT